LPCRYCRRFQQNAILKGKVLVLSALAQQKVTADYVFVLNFKKPEYDKYQEEYFRQIF